MEGRKSSNSEFLPDFFEENVILSMKEVQISVHTERKIMECSCYLVNVPVASLPGLWLAAAIAGGFP